jgi:microcystin-dependent protein
MSSVLRRSGYRSAVERPAVGDTKTSMVRVDHLGWLVCDGRSLLRSDYRNLFAVIGTEFGSDDSTHFNLPDARGRVVGLINQDNENVIARTDLSGWDDGDISGEEMHTLTIDEMPLHSHDPTTSNANGIPASGPSHTGNTNTNSSGPAPTSGSGTSAADSATEPHNHELKNVGGGDAHNNMQPTLFMGNLFIFCGQVLKNITGPDGLTRIAPGGTDRFPSYYPPSTDFTQRLY